MSFQLIYTSALNLLDSPGSGYGTVARTEDIPRRLAQKLENISTYRDPNESGITGTQFTYQILEYNGAAYHVLSATRSAGADYSGRACHITHHLALTPEEVIALKNNDKRPTPAGIILALQQSAFWVDSWQGEPRLLNGEPRMSASSLPDATTQAHWKKLTLHKSNARAFFTPPYDRDCLCIVPEGVTSDDILLLLHESDWLSVSRGWGKTFTTHGTTSDSFSFTRRIFTIAGTAVAAKIEKLGKPRLEISTDMQLPQPPEEHQAPGSSTMQHPMQASGAEEDEPPTSSPFTSPYRYCESDDADTYDLPRKGINWLRISGLTLGIGILIGGGLLLQFGVPNRHPLQMTEDDSPAEESERSDASPAQDAHNLRGLVDRLREFTQAPYDRTAAQRTLDRLAAQVRQLPFPDSPDASAFLACLTSLKDADRLSSDYAAELISLMQYAHQFRLDEHALAKLFMHQVTYARNPDRVWLDALNAEYPRWAFLFSRFSGMPVWMHREFGAHMDPIIRRAAEEPTLGTPHQLVEGVMPPSQSPPDWAQDTPLPTPSPAASLDKETVAPDSAGRNDAEVPAGVVPVMIRQPFALATGQQNDTILTMLQAATLEPIGQGELIICHSEQSGRDPMRLQLAPQNATLHVERTVAEHSETYTIHLITSNGTVEPNFHLEIRFEDAMLAQITFNETTPQLVCIPLPAGDHSMHPTIMVSPVEIPILIHGSKQKAPRLPLKKRFSLQADLNQQDEAAFSLQVAPGFAEDDAYQLPEIPLSTASGSGLSIPSIGYVCRFSPIGDTLVDGMSYSARFHAIPDGNEKFDITPDISCSINFQDFATRQLAEISQRFPIKSGGQTIPLAKLYFAVQEFRKGAGTQHSPEQLAGYYIQATRPPQSTTKNYKVYKFFEKNLGTRFFTTDSDTVQKLFSSQLECSLVEKSVTFLVFGALQERFQPYFGELMRQASSTKLILRLYKIDVQQNTLEWQFELCSPSGDTQPAPTP